ncbi:hypothetical protein AAFF_G00175560 [Aldrovandia affinis]|uniref:Reverse transcriptase/retrotransposon-derived protein RNase H-like domain-containing protein n=1 Tax=Aldrovandia affinis TaxID=143900 RepID=A0AAD7RL03_9TELE|nr:hypothetical protein AAFF_G00175560 [Aldrovandia affinis]
MLICLQRREPKRHSWGVGLYSPGAGDGAESVMVVGWTHAGNFCYVPVALAGAPCSALVDTGSTATLMRPDMVPVGTQLEQTSVQLRTVTGELAPMLGRGKVVITVGGLSVELRVWVAEVQDPCILGLDFLKFARCLLDLGENTLSFPGGPTVRMISPPRSSRSAPLAVKTTETQSSRPLNARPRCSPAYSTAERSSPIPPTPDSQLTSPAGSTPLSPSAAPFTPSAPLPLAQPNMEEEADRLAVVRGIWERSCGHLEPEQQEELWQLLTEFKGIFALTDAEIGRTHLVHHQIDTGDARPIRSPPRRLPMAYREAAECAIDEMQHAGIIEPSASPWASGVVMVKKKNTSKMRFCVDYRPLNKEKGADFTWAPECQQAFDLLKNALTEAPVLRPPDLSLPFVLDTDASNVGMGAVLSQWVETGQRPPWGEVAGGTTATKGLWADFAALRVCDGVLQRAWREPATGENRWRVVVPKAMRRLC